MLEWLLFFIAGALVYPVLSDHLSEKRAMAQTRRQRAIDNNHPEPLTRNRASVNTFERLHTLKGWLMLLVCLPLLILGIIMGLV